MNSRLTVYICGLLVCILFGVTLYSFSASANRKYQEIEKSSVVPTTSTTTTTTKKIDIKNINLTAVGDCTLGSDSNFGYSLSFYEMYDKQNDDSYFFSGVSNITKNDDVTIANLETTFTDATEKAVKAFNFKGPANYANILTAGSVEVVNIANNHSHDFLEQGYTDTKVALDNVKVGYAGNDSTYIYGVKGIKIGFIGYPESEVSHSKVLKGINSLKEQGANLIIVSYHWGIEKEYKQNSFQENLGRWTIDNGANLVLGTHPHVIQGIENYNGGYIVYSMANFVFGGNQNPNDKDTFVFTETFTFTDNELTNTNINVYPARVSSVTNRNDYKPVILEGTERQRVLDKINLYSKNVTLR